MASPLPPHDLEAESAVLGILLLDHPIAKFDLIAHLVTGEDFYSGAHQAIFELCAKLAAKQKPCDLLTVAGYIRTDSRLGQVGGVSYLTQLVNSGFIAERFEDYARRIREQASVRRAIAEAQRVAAEGYSLPSEPESASRFLVQAADSFASLAQKAANGKDAVAAKDAVREVLEDLRRVAAEGRMPGTPTGYASLDELTDGLQPGNLIVLAARTGMGKTTFALNVATHAAKARETGPQDHVLFFSLEMSRHELAKKILGITARINPKDLRAGKPGTFSKVLEAMASKTEFPRNLWIDDTPSQTTFSIRAAVVKKRMQLERQGDRLALVVVDHLLLVRPSDRRRREESRAEEVGQMTRDMKNLAAEMQLPVLLLAQMNRDAVKGEKKRPELFHLKSSGDIEQDANVVLFIWAKDERGENEDSRPVMVTVAKNRNGRPDCDLPFTFHRHRSLFEPRDDDAHERAAPPPVPHWQDREDNYF